MKRVNGILLLCLFLLAAACGGPEPDTSGGPVVPSETFMERFYSFREEGDSTRFVIGFEGTSVLEADIRLCLLTREGDTLYIDTLSADDLSPGTAGQPDSVRSEAVLSAMKALIDQPPVRVPADTQGPVNYWYRYRSGPGKLTEVSWNSVKKAIHREDQNAP